MNKKRYRKKIVVNNPGRVDITGKRFNMLVAVEYAYTRNNQAHWLFQCDCGNRKIICRNNVRVKKDHPIKSCGCLRKEVASSGTNPRTHGMSYTRFYNIWHGMKARCFNSKSKKYERYGGRGIKVCKEWIKFDNFRDDMYDNYERHVKEYGTKETSIDRINNNGDYYKDNCRWATNIEQQNNKG